ncbi:acyl-CoA dehydrogenase family protein [Streptomyces botrytidirepellens]|uniref:acyl-CoA dehydrogenase family protein n=1 Tax=Streptomyces botrytidirepellens TaxID=2486417 RepID=UPI0024827B1A|nr:acyl-CoA dehydrogenase family protein [Streptomyces botrytidirepellens]
MGGVRGRAARLHVHAPPTPVDADGVERDLHGGLVALGGVERDFRDAPLMIVGEGTNEIQRNVIASRLVKRGGPE